MNRRHVLVWALYDFAGSVYPAVITATVFSVYFAGAIVGNQTGQGDLWWGRVLSFSMLFVAFSSPLLGTVADRAGVRKRLLVFYTALCIVSVALFTTLEPGRIAWAFAVAVLANIGFEGALVFYNAYLPEIAPPEKRGRVSALGFGLGYAGSALGLLAVLPLVRSESFDLVWLVVAGLFAVFAIPALVGLPAGRPAQVKVGRALVEGFQGFRRLAADVWRLPDLRRFLLAYFLYIDGINTTTYFSSLFATKTLGFSPQELVVLFLVVQISALVGAFAWAVPTDRWGPKRVITLTLFLWIGVSLTALVVNSKAAFYGVAVAAGSGLGSIQAASRAYMAALIPAGKEGEMFGFYAFCGKSSSVIGPLVFGAVSYAMGGNQRFAVVSIGLFFVAGLLLLARVRPVLSGRATA